MYNLFSSTHVVQHLQQFFLQDQQILLCNRGYFLSLNFENGIPSESLKKLISEKKLGTFWHYFIRIIKFNIILKFSMDISIYLLIKIIQTICLVGCFVNLSLVLNWNLLRLLFKNKIKQEFVDLITTRI